MAVVVLAGGGVAYAMSGDSGPQYRLATVTRTTVEQTVDESGTVATVSQSSAAFPVSGEVATVPVQLGQTVTAGQTLATLDTTSLQQSLQSANSTAATARQTLANDEAEQSSSGTATDTAYERPLTAAPSSGPGSGGSGSGGSASGGGATRALQTAVTTAQHDLDQAIAQVDSDVAAAVKACQTGAAGSMTIAVTADASGDVKGDVGSGQAVTVTLENPDGSPVTGSTPAGP
ncbi:MAG: biotin/lipoyl-binding protein, partial [Actinobacteria bacterium]|nr:biotin/lipoyl-binding protein [Actinomycetota bacterium]